MSLLFGFATKINILSETAQLLYPLIRSYQHGRLRLV